VTGLFEDLHPRISYQANRIRFEKPSRSRRPDRDYTLQGSGLQFAPSVFGANDFTWQISPEWPPMIVYTPRGVGQWRQKLPEPDQSLEIALGTGRARVLSALATPLTTGEVARRLDLTAGAVSQHLGRLEQAGLVTPHRSGKRVFYHLTARGEQLLSLFGGI
ncbi:MAG: winged helix-turn-helix domain-containing protein, partial [Anaerolineae bacterium]|nr:winged helix-turn-helix domain-containing protein [Anaerolineae bacterium]